MDSQTQALLGAVTAQLGFRQRIGRDATLVAAGAAYAPDLDALTAPLLRAFGYDDPFAGIVIHRSATHSLLAIPLIALAVAWPWWHIHRWLARRRADRDPQAGHSPPGFGLLYLCCLVAVATAAPLDWCTSYGTQILWPLSTERYGIDAIAIMDILFTPLLIVTLVTCWIVRRGKANKRKRATFAIGLVGLLLAVGYIGAGRLLHDWAVARARQEVSAERLVRVEAYPMIGTIFLWRTVIETPDAWIVMRLHWFADPSAPPQTERVAKPPPNPWIARARQTRAYRVSRWFTSGCLRLAYREQEGRHVVELHDMRFGLSTTDTTSLWPVRITFTDPATPPEVRRLRMRRDVQRGEVVRRLWYEIWNP